MAARKGAARKNVVESLVNAWLIKPLVPPVTMPGVSAIVRV